ncbi:hypothetical protein AB0L57_25440 [Nocardia sp. NPDC052254]|uniref:hypothetical protein n=1 Tax=Nocardia sp. NPDC052254 TaxID=3155681 RepID=UPI003418A576
MVDQADLNLGPGTDGSWVTINSADSSAQWAGYGKHGNTDVAANRVLTNDVGDYDHADPGLDAGKILGGDAWVANAAFGDYDCLRWFHLVQARYAFSGRSAGNAVPELQSKEAIGKLYLLQKDMRLNHLVGAGQRIARALTKIEQARGDQAQATQQLADYWQGPTGADVQGKLAKLSTWSDDTLGELKPLPDLLNTVVDEIKTCLKRKANAFAKFKDIHRINGADMTNGDSAGQAVNLRDDDDAANGNDDVSMIINVAARRGIGNGVRARIQDLADRGIFGGPRDYHVLPHYVVNQVGYDDDGTTAGQYEFDDKASALCAIWRDQFCESAEGYFRAYANLCHQTDVAVQGYLQVAVDALNGVGHIPKPPQPTDPGPQPSTPNPSIPGPAVPGNPASTIPASTTPSPTNPAGSQTNPAQQLLSSLAGQASQTVQQGLGQTLQQGMSQIQNVAQQGLGSLGGNLSSLGSQIPGVGSVLTDAKGATGPKELANLSAFGGNLTVSQAANGAITAKVTGPDGKPQEYSMGIKDGVPYLKPGPADSDPAAADPAQGTGSGKGTPGARSGIPGGGGSPQSANTPPEGRSPGSVPGHSVDPRAGEPDSGGSSPTAGPTDPGTSQNGMPGMPGMPGGGKPAPGAERPPAGIVPPKPMWTTVPGDDAQIPGGPVGPPSTGPELATVGPLDGAAVAPTSGPELATSGPLNAPPPEQASAPVATPTARPSDGVKIEIDMGETK